VQTRKELHEAIEMARNYKPLTEEEVSELLDLSYEKAQDGSVEEYKVANYGCNWYHDNFPAF
jgi:hypothetical protein